MQFLKMDGSVVRYDEVIHENGAPDARLSGVPSEINGDPTWGLHYMPTESASPGRPKHVNTP